MEEDILVAQCDARTCSPGRVFKSSHCGAQRQHRRFSLCCASLQVDGRPPVTSTASVFRDEKVADLFFKTERCMRVDQSACWPKGERLLMFMQDAGFFRAQGCAQLCRAP
jgi:hypothetical protein